MPGNHSGSFDLHLTARETRTVLALRQLPEYVQYVCAEFIQDQVNQRPRDKANRFNVIQGGRA